MTIEDVKNYIEALEKSVNEDILKLKKMQEVNTKFGDMQSFKESIFKKRREIAKLSKDVKDAK